MTIFLLFLFVLLTAWTDLSIGGDLFMHLCHHRYCEMVSSVQFISRWHSTVWYHSIMCFCKRDGTTILAFLQISCLDIPPYEKNAFDKASFSMSRIFFRLLSAFCHLYNAGRREGDCHKSSPLWHNKTNPSTSLLWWELCVDWVFHPCQVCWECQQQHSFPLLCIGGLESTLWCTNSIAWPCQSWMSCMLNSHDQSVHKFVDQGGCFWIPSELWL